MQPKPSPQGAPSPPGRAPGALAAAPRREGALLGAILLLALALRLWALTQNGWGADYYTAAVLSMAGSLHNFLHAAFDPAGFLSVDKPPLALWMQVASVRLFGFSPLAVLAPQALAGVAAVWLLYRAVRHGFGATAALSAALLLAVTPVWVAVNRTNNVDTWLVTLQLAAACAVLVASERGSRRHLLLAALALGLAFNVKMLAAFVALPGLVLPYLLFAPLPWPRRLLDLALAGVLLAAVALSWSAWRESTPTDQRPYVGSSRSNSGFELIVGHNALARFVAQRAAPAARTPPAARTAGDEGPPGAADASPAGDTGAQAGPQPMARGTDTRSNVRRLIARLFVGTPPGPLRLAQGQLAAQLMWLLPVALVGAIAGARRGGGGAPATAPSPAPSPATAPSPAAGDALRRRRLGIALWAGWSLSAWAVFSHLGGIVHFYYLAGLAPAMAAFAGIGVATLLRRTRPAHAMVAAAIFPVAAAWQFWVQGSAMDWSAAEMLSPPAPWLAALHLGAAGACLLAVFAVVLAARRAGAGRGLHAAGVATGSAGLLVLPLAWCASSVLLPAQGMLPSADLARLVVAAADPRAIPAARFGRPPELGRLLAFLQANRRGERFLLTSSTTQLAAPIIVATGAPVLARGGFHGTDPALTPERLAALVARGEVRYAMLGDVAQLSRRRGADEVARPVTDWIRANGRPVDPALWREGRIQARLELFDLLPADADAQGGR